MLGGALGSCEVNPWDVATTGTARSADVEHRHPRFTLTERDHFLDLHIPRFGVSAGLGASESHIYDVEEVVSIDLLNRSHDRDECSSPFLPCRWPFMTPQTLPLYPKNLKDFWG
ncbi:hypothetical protein U1Q18_022785 [Sarracenia purpurea var. burkii]